MAGWWLKRQLFIKLRVYTYKKGMQKTIQNIHRTLHNPLHLFDYLNVTRCRICVLNPTQNLHWNRHKPYTETVTTLHWNGQNPTLKPALKRAKPYTKTIHESLHRNPTFCFLNTNQTNGTNEREWIVRNERTNVTNKTNMASLLQADSSHPQADSSLSL